MAIPILCAGQDYIAMETDTQGREVYIYAYRSLQGELFTCEASSEAEAYDKCRKWLLRHERH